VTAAVEDLPIRRLRRDATFEVLTVCTGNICRSPLAAALLHTRLSAWGARVHSAGIHGLDDAPMTPEALRLADELGADGAYAAAHRSRYLTEGELASPDLILAMSREHRRRVVEYAPSRLRSTFTVREFARLAREASDAEIIAAADAAEPNASARIRAAVAAVAGMRGAGMPPADPADDDVVDPYRRSWATYQLSAAQLAPAVAEVGRVLTLAIRPRGE